MQRRHFLRATAPAALGFALVPRRSLAHPAAFDSASLTKIETHLRHLLRETAVPGAALAVIQGGRLVWQRAFGVRDAATRLPVDEHTVFECASISKTVFAYVVLHLCERGILDLDRPLTRYTRNRFFEGDPRLDQVTARHALAHTTGFPEWRSGKPAMRILSAPGQRFLYSGEGYFYLQSVVSEIAGRSFGAPCGRYEADLEVCATDFDDFMRRSLLQPLEMRASGYVWRDAFEPVAARPHNTAGNQLPVKRPHAADVARYGAAGELRTTVGDYAKFLRAVLTLPQGPAFLSSRRRDEMLRPHVKLDPAAKVDGADSWALGWAIQERPTGHVILHSGGQSGFRSLTMASVARQSGFVLFTNSDNGGRVCFDQTLGGLLTPLLAA